MTSDERQAAVARCTLALQLRLAAALRYVDDYPKAVQTASVLFDLYAVESRRLVGYRIKAQVNPDYRDLIAPQAVAVETFTQALRLYLRRACGEVSTSETDLDEIIELFEARLRAERGETC